MIGNDLEIEIIELFRRDITSLLSINQIATLLGKSYPYIHKKVLSFIDDEIFNQTKIGSSTLCSINLQNEEAVTLLTINEIKQKKILIKKNKQLSATISKLKKTKDVPIQTAIYSKGKTIVVTDNKFYKRTLKEQINNIQVLTKEEFLENTVEDYSKIKSHILLYHNEKYYELISEIEEALKAKYSILAK